MTVTVFELTPLPLTVTVALRELVDELALVAVTVTVLSPEPLVGETVNQLALSDTVQLTLELMVKFP